jgi:hypothetical protein
MWYLKHYEKNPISTDIVDQSDFIEAIKIPHSYAQDVIKGIFNINAGAIFLLITFIGTSMSGNLIDPYFFKGLKISLALFSIGLFTAVSANFCNFLAVTETLAHKFSEDSLSPIMKTKQWGIRFAFISITCFILGVGISVAFMPSLKPHSAAIKIVNQPTLQQK